MTAFTSIVSGLVLTTALVAAASAPAAAGKLEILYEFPSYDAAGNKVHPPQTGVTLTPDGRVFGTNGLVLMPPSGIRTFGSIFRLTPPAVAGKRWTYDLIHGFGTEAGSPQAELTLTSGGTLIGGTAGFYRNFGNLFELSPTTATPTGWRYTSLHSFTRAQGAGEGPTGPLLEAPDGSFYGTSDGDYYTSGLGAVFRLTKPSDPSCPCDFERIFKFDILGKDGGYPSSALIAGAKGVLHGTVRQGPSGSGGAVFTLTPPATAGGAWTYKVIHELPDTPLWSGVVADPAGNLYGAARNGGAHNNGYIYRLAPPTKARKTWSFSRLYSFPGGAMGRTPLGELQRGPDGSLYGVTSEGEYLYTGAIFKLTPPAVAGGRWTPSRLQSFTGRPGGAHPIGKLAFGPGGWIYGVTNGAGASDNGLVYRWKP